MQMQSNVSSLTPGEAATSPGFTGNHITGYIQAGLLECPPIAVINTNGQRAAFVSETVPGATWGWLPKNLPFQLLGQQAVLLLLIRPRVSSCL